MKTGMLTFIYPLLKNRKSLPLITGSIFVFLAFMSSRLAISKRYIPSEGYSSFTTAPIPPRDVERYFSTLLYKDMASTTSHSGFPSELLFLPDTKNIKQLISEEFLMQVSLHVENRDWEKYLEALHSLNVECKSTVAAYFARRFADSGDFDICEFFLQECRDGISFKELYDLDIQIIRIRKREDWKDQILKSLQQNLAISQGSEEAMALQYVIKVLFIGCIMEQEGKKEEVSSFYEKSVEEIEQWASVDLPVSWHYILPAFLHFRLWRNQEKNFISMEDTEKALARMRHSVPVNRWTWRYHQAVRHRAQTLIRNKKDNPSN